MGIYRCNYCKHIQEHILHRSLPNQVACSKCQHTVTVYDTAYFVKYVIERYAAALREIEILKNQSDEVNASEAGVSESNDLNTLNFHETDQFATEKQHKLLKDWFEKHHIQPEFDYSAVNMSGFYDEAAEKIGLNYAIFEKIIKQINWAYHKNITNLNFDLKKYNQKEQQSINNICREFYSHTLFSVYNYKKQDKNLFLKLQPATPIRQFFSGEWLEWFALNVALQQVYTKKRPFSVARNTKIRFDNEDLHELDVVLLTPNFKPIVIECKTGEYRKDLDKYLNLRKRLNIPAQNYILLVLDINDAQAKSLSSMYDLTFATLNTLAECVKKVI